MAFDELTLIIGDAMVSGWTSVRVTRGIERLPSDFEIQMTDLRGLVSPSTMAAVGDAIKEGDPCRVMLGSDLVITGYIDRYEVSIGPDSHTISVKGRGKCQDLVDCAAEWPGMQISASTVLDIAKKLAAPYGIQVSGDAKETGQPLPFTHINLGETAYDLIERFARFHALLVYDAPDGNLILSRVGRGRAASGFAEGVNVQQASASFTMDQRFSEYLVLVQSFDQHADAGASGNLISTIHDPGVPRHRRKIIIAESGTSGTGIAALRGQWECNRRAGRSKQVQLVTDSWRDSAGKLWTPNSLARLDLPSLRLKGVEWIIGQVSFERGEQGTTATLTLMPPEAFSVEPGMIQDGLRELPGGFGGAPSLLPDDGNPKPRPGFEPPPVQYPRG